MARKKIGEFKMQTSGELGADTHKAIADIARTAAQEAVRPAALPSDTRSQREKDKARARKAGYADSSIGDYADGAEYARAHERGTVVAFLRREASLHPTGSKQQTCMLACAKQIEHGDHVS